MAYWPIDEIYLSRASWWAPEKKLVRVLAISFIRVSSCNKICSIFSSFVSAHSAYWSPGLSPRHDKARCWGKVIPQYLTDFPRRQLAFHDASWAQLKSILIQYRCCRRRALLLPNLLSHSCEQQQIRSMEYGNSRILWSGEGDCFCLKEVFAVFIIVLRCMRMQSFQDKTVMQR